MPPGNVDPSNRVVVSPRDGDSAELSNISLSTIQALYHEITGRTEMLSAEYHGNYKVTDENLIQLNCKMHQFLELHNVIKVTQSLEIEHANDETNRISFWEKYLQCDKTSTNLILELKSKYTFLNLVAAVKKKPG
jgi:hypothetical protein